MRICISFVSVRKSHMHFHLLLKNPICVNLSMHFSQNHIVADSLFWCGNDDMNEQTMIMFYNYNSRVKCWFDGFTEMMRALGYHRLISFENFRVSNFPLVAEILQWLVKRYDPNVELPFDVETETDRITFIKSVAQFMATKAHIKLNTKKLYIADGYAVKELLKVACLLYEAMRAKDDADYEPSNDDDSMNFSFDISSKLRDLKLTRQIAGEITLKGSSLYNVLAKEIELREVRSYVLSKQLDITEVEQGLRGASKSVEEEIQKTSKLIENIAADEANLEAKIEKKKVDLERNHKRLQTLKSVRPAFMDEYERLEQELEQLYEQYVTKFNWLAYLDQQLEELEKIEQEIIMQKEEATRKIVEKLRQEEMLKSEETAGDEFITVDRENETSAEGRTEKPHRPQPAASGVRRDSTRRVFGSMSGGEREDSLETDSDLDLDGEDDEDGSEVSDDEHDLEVLTKTAPTNNLALQDSDNDF